MGCNDGNRHNFPRHLRKESQKLLLDFLDVDESDMAQIYTPRTSSEKVEKKSAFFSVFCTVHKKNCTIYVGIEKVYIPHIYSKVHI